MKFLWLTHANSQMTTLYRKLCLGKQLQRFLYEAYGAEYDSRRHYVSFTCANAESYLSWHGFLQDFWESRVKNVRLITSDAHTGLTKTISEVFPESYTL